MSRETAEFSERLKAARERLIATNISDPALAVCIAGLGRLEEALRKPLRIVVLGENNSGKTSVTDLLIGQGLLPTSVVSNSHVPVQISYAEQAAVYGISSEGMRIRVDGQGEDDALTDLSYRALQVLLPIDWLRTYQVLDTPPSVPPATFIDDADIVIWCTVATRAWTESERAAWAALPGRCSRNALLVATHKDGLATDDDISYVTQRLKALTSSQFREVVLVDGEAASEDGRALDADWSGADELRAAVGRLAAVIMERRSQKAEKIVRRLARLTFHQFASDEVRPEAAGLLLRWEEQTRHLLDMLRENKTTVQEALEVLLVAYAHYAEKLRPGVVRGDDVVVASTSRAVAAPVRWPRQSSAAARLVSTLASDLTGLLRMLAGRSSFADPALRAEYNAARAIVLTLADLDGAFDALGRMLGSSLISEKA